METDLLGDAGLSRVEKVMDYLVKRHEALAANVANLSTPGYKTVDVRFQDALDAELSEIKLVRTSPRHFEVIVPETGFELAEVEGLVAGADGNNVDLDRELLAMTLNRLRFQLGVQWATGRLSTIRTAIREGGAV